jgi:hypothetical protein
MPKKVHSTSFHYGLAGKRYTRRRCFFLIGLSSPPRAFEAAELESPVYDRRVGRQPYATPIDDVAIHNQLNVGSRPHDGAFLKATPGTLLPC